MLHPAKVEQFSGVAPKKVCENSENMKYIKNNHKNRRSCEKITTCRMTFFSKQFDSTLTKSNKSGQFGAPIQLDHHFHQSLI